MGRFVDCGQDGVFVATQNDQDFGALGDQSVDVRQLLLGGSAGIGHDVFGTGLGQLRLDGRFVGFPALFLEGVVAHADDQLCER